MKIITLLIIIALTGCASMQVNSLEGRRDCLIQAIGFQDAYKNDKRFDPYRWSRILGIFWDDDRRIGHAVHVYRFEDSIMVQGAGEKRGGWTLTKNLKLMDKPLELARLYAPNTAVREAYYFEDLTKTER